MLAQKFRHYHRCDGRTFGKYSGYAYMSTGTANNSSYPKPDWTPGVGFNLGYQFGFDLSNRFWIDASILGKAVQGKAESFDLNGNNVVPCLTRHGYGDLL